MSNMLKPSYVDFDFDHDEYKKRLQVYSLKSDIGVIKQMLPSLTPKIAEQERDKGDIVGKPLTHINILDALEQDGLFKPIASKEK